MTSREQQMTSEEREAIHAQMRKMFWGQAELPYPIGESDDDLEKYGFTPHFQLIETPDNENIWDKITIAEQAFAARLFTVPNFTSRSYNHFREISFSGDDLPTDQFELARNLCNKNTEEQKSPCALVVSTIVSNTVANQPPLHWVHRVFPIIDVDIDEEYSEEVMHTKCVLTTKDPLIKLEVARSY